MNDWLISSAIGDSPTTYTPSFSPTVSNAFWINLNVSLSSTPYLELIIALEYLSDTNNFLASSIVFLASLIVFVISASKKLEYFSSFNKSLFK